MQIGDAVEIVVADRHHECARVGQRARIIGRYGQLWQLHLRCGHIWPMPESALRLLDAEEAAPPPVQTETATERSRREERARREEAEARAEAALAEADDE
jgi:hypothetical protein